MEKLPSTKPVPGAKKVGDRWLKQHIYWTDFGDSDAVHGLENQGWGWEDTQDVPENRGADTHSRRSLVSRCFPSKHCCRFTGLLLRLPGCQKVGRRPDGGHALWRRKGWRSPALSPTAGNLEPTTINPLTPITTGGRRFLQRNRVTTWRGWRESSVTRGAVTIYTNTRSCKFTNILYVVIRVDSYFSKTAMTFNI